MCLTIPKKVIAVRKDYVEVCSENSKESQKAGALIDVKKGDWVFTQNNFIVQKISKKQAQEINKIFNK